MDHRNIMSLLVVFTIKWENSFSRGVASVNFLRVRFVSVVEISLDL